MPPGPEFQVGAGLATGLVALLVNTLFVYFAARIVLDRSSFLASFATALVGTFLASLVWAAVGGTLGLVLGLAAWALAAAFFFRTAWVKGAVVGLVAWVLWVVTAWVVDAIL